MDHVPQISSFLSRVIFLLTLCIILFTNPTLSAPYPNSYQDICIADLWASPLNNNDFPCKPHVSSDDFFYSGLNNPLNISNPRGVAANPANVLTFPGLHKMGISMYNVLMAGGKINSPHLHPGATEAGVVIEGTVSVGFLTTNYTLFSKVIGPGDMFVIPPGLIHYETNVGKTHARLLTVVADELPSEVVLPHTLLLTKPAIPNAVLMEAFRADGKTINMLRSKFTT
ncbi:Germin-like protein subfamily T member 3 [Cardamine amara subsp. amara]|uniref:Germin-like protein n=1 Tax=Cardamine amara subsp. amara TaxID=228776 RepID=A0ABD1BCR6_CARAN